ncbi:hypothetical protein GUJ93_ZPchr0007g3423 [Zizania palustris]|uniref:Pentatricopeptide repeat-containing protein n=1 Tax=Zizania palustris TaxID=103762 RepID=A0A8J5T398_ZIZPA|nr:hypothetical protein GUJ93_ZPchr0007g3423 [Zizania palustris]
MACQHPPPIAAALQHRRSTAAAPSSFSRRTVAVSPALRLIPPHPHADILLCGRRPSCDASPECIHLEIVKTGLTHDLFLDNHLINSYGKGARLDSAHRVFDEMPEQNAISWNVISTKCLDSYLGSLTMPFRCSAPYCGRGQGAGLRRSPLGACSEHAKMRGRTCWPSPCRSMG